jgi:hypothetical protein
MFTLRAAHLRAFEQAALEQFEDRMAAHVREEFPEEWEGLGEATVRQHIGHGLAKAESYGITAEQDVCLYIDLVILLGPNFDTDPTMPWARAILRDPGRPDPSARMEHLYDVAVAEMERQEVGTTGGAA